MKFRKLERNDLHKLLDLKEESYRTTHNVTIANIEDQNRWFDSLDRHVNSPRNLCLVANVEDTPIGIFKIFNVDWVSQTADIGWDVFKEYRNQGFGKMIVEAGVNYSFEVLNLRRLTAEILSNNPASQKCALSAGLSLEGIKKESVFKHFDNTDFFLDSLMYAILRRDWLYNKGSS